MPTEKSLKIQKDKFTEEFLEPISKITDSASLLLSNEGVTAICSTDTTNIILYAKYTGTTVEESCKINLHDIKRFIRLLDCIQSVELDIGITSNTLNYKSTKLKFKYHLAEDAMMRLTKLSVSKISALTFDSRFFIDRSKVQELLKFSSTVNDCVKMYFTVAKDVGVLAEISDHQTAQTDSVSMSICDEFEGTEIHTPLPINLEVLRLLVGINFDKVLVKINTELKVLMFELQVGDSHLKYIVSSLVK